MKHFFSIALVSLLSFGLTNCSDDDDLDRQIQPDPDGLNITSNIAERYTLTNEAGDSIAQLIEWNAVNFGFPTDITYEVQGATNEDFRDATVLSSTGETTASISVDQLLGLAATAGLDNSPQTGVEDAEGNPVLDEDGNPIPNNSGSLYVRLHAVAGNGNANTVEQFSQVQTLNVFLPDNLGEELPAMLYVVGNFLDDASYGAEWNAADAVALAASSPNETDFQGYVSIPNANAEFKFLPNLGNFDGDYGDTGAANGAYSQLLEQEEEVNCGTPGGVSGYFLVEANTQELTYSLRAQEWGIIGEATPAGWDNDTMLTYNAQDKTWTADIELVPGVFKFRANSSWDNSMDNFGAGDGENMLSFGGDDLTFNGDAGNYHIVLDLSNPRAYTYSITAN